MAEINGADVVLRVDVAGTPTTIGSQTNVTFSESLDMIDISSKDARARAILPGRYSCTVNLDALFVPSASDLAAIKSAIRNATAVDIRRRYNSTDLEEASCYISGNDESFPDQGPATISVVCEIDGEWSAV